MVIRNDWLKIDEREQLICLKWLILICKVEYY